MWNIGWAPNNVSQWQMGFNSAFKGLISRMLPKLRHKLRHSKLVKLATPDNMCQQTQTYTTSGKAF